MTRNFRLHGVLSPRNWAMPQPAKAMAQTNDGRNLQGPTGATPYYTIPMFEVYCRVLGGAIKKPPLPRVNMGALGVRWRAGPIGTGAGLRRVVAAFWSALRACKEGGNGDTARVMAR